MASQVGVSFVSGLELPLVTAGSGMDIPFWSFGGSTVVSSNYVRLTPDRQSKKGSIWNTYVSSDIKYRVTKVQ